VVRSTWYTEYARSEATRQDNNSNCVPEPGFSVGAHSGGVTPVVEAADIGKEQVSWNDV
jgi:hypothetical protein